MPGRDHGGISGRNFIAVDRVREPGRGRHASECGFDVGLIVLIRMRDGLDIGLNRLEIRDPLRAADDDVVQGTALPAGGVLDQVEMFRPGLCKGLKVAPDLLGRTDSFSGSMAQNLVDRGDLGVEIAVAEPFFGLDLQAQAQNQQ